MNISQIKISELAKISNSSLPLLSKYFRQIEDSDSVTKINNRIIGISPEAAEKYLFSMGINYFDKPAIFLSANLCGGVGKTTSILSLGACLRRITGRDTPIVYVDGDSQGSFTSSVFGSPASEDELLLIDFLEGQAKIEDILIPINDNIWFVKSNLNQAYIDKVIGKAQDVKKSMLHFYESVFAKLGNKTKIFQDHTPQVSNLFSSSICALNQLNNDIKKVVLIPIRSDKFAIQGAEYILNEIKDITDTFSLKNSIDIYCFFSSIDKRVSTTAEAIKVTGGKENIRNHLAGIVIRYCSEIPKSIMNSTNIYGSGKINNAAQDYQDLLQYIFCPK